MTLQDLGSLGEFVAAIATVVTLVYLAIQIRASNRLARAEASRAPNSDLNSINAAFGPSLEFRRAVRKVVGGASRPELEPDERLLVDYYLVSITNIQEQLAREVREGVLPPSARDFGGRGLFALPYYRESWPLYREHLSSPFVAEWEAEQGLDPTIDAEW